MNKANRALRWIGLGTLTLGIIPLLITLLRDLPAAMREVKLAKMGNRGGWHPAH